MFGFSKKKKSPKRAFKYALSKGKPIPELELLIAQSAKYSYLYAKEILKGRFELGEQAISQDAEYSFMYARDILNGRFELGEETIATNAEYSYLYAKEILKGRFELGEPSINKYYNFSYLYKNNFLEDKKTNKPKENNKILSAKEARDFKGVINDNLNFDDLIEQIEEKIIASANKPLNGAEIEVSFTRFQDGQTEIFSQLLLDAGYYVCVTSNHETNKYRFSVQWVNHGCNVCGYMFGEMSNIIYCHLCIDGEYFYEEW